MNKQLIKLLVLGLGFAVVGNTLVAVEEAKAPEAKKEEVKAPVVETKKEEVKAPEVKKEEVKAPEVKKEEAKAPEAKKEEVKAPAVETKKEATKTCACCTFMSNHKTALWVTGGVLTVAAIAAIAYYYDLLGLNDKEETEEKA